MCAVPSEEWSLLGKHLDIQREGYVLLFPPSTIVPQWHALYMVAMLPHRLEWNTVRVFTCRMKENLFFFPSLHVTWHEEMGKSDPQFRSGANSSCPSQPSNCVLKQRRGEIDVPIMCLLWLAVKLITWSGSPFYHLQIITRDPKMLVTAYSQCCEYALNTEISVARDTYVWCVAITAHPHC